MKKKVFRLWAVLIAIAFLAAACSMATSGLAIKDAAMQAVKTEKEIAESILFDARVLYNTGHIQKEQFDSIRKSYDELKAAQDVLIDAYAAWLRAPNTENESLYRVNVLRVINIMKVLTGLAAAAGVKVDNGPPPAAGK